MYNSISNNKHLKQIKKALNGGYVNFSNEEFTQEYKKRQPLEKTSILFKLSLSKVEQLTYSIYPILYKLSQKGISDLLHKKSGLLQTCKYTIEDSQSAIDDYKRLSSVDFKEIKYLALYGLLQALFVQQDAIQTLYETCTKEKLNFFTYYPQLKEVREIRNITIGHPTNKGGNYFLISQSTFNKMGYYLIEHGLDDKKTGKQIDIFPKLLLAQELMIIDVYKRLRVRLRSFLRDQK